MQNQNFNKIVVVAGVIQPLTDPETENSQILLKRRLGETYYPEIFEMPGGKVDTTNPTIRDALIRELKEETGLEVIYGFSQLPDFTYSTGETTRGDDGPGEKIRKHAIQLSFAVLVDGADFRISLDEHSTGL